MIFFSTELILNCWFLVLGAVVGSFLNLVIYRLPRGYYIHIPSRSICVTCNRKLEFYENVPIFSYLFLKGKCRTCHSSIGFRYLLVEVLTSLMFYATYKIFGFHLETLFYCIFSACLIAITFIDIDFRIIPDEISIYGTILVILISPFFENLGFTKSLSGAIAGGGSFWLLGFIYEKITKREGLGFGDVKLLAFIGACLGPKGVVTTIVFSSFIGSVIGITVMLIQGKNLKLAIPYGPFLAMGAWIELFWGDQLSLIFFRLN